MFSLTKREEEREMAGEKLCTEPTSPPSPHPSEYMSLFPYGYFNPIQTQLFWPLFHTDECVLVGAPTGSGKTVLAELGVLRILERRKKEEERRRRDGETGKEGEREGGKEKGDGGERESGSREEGEKDVGRGKVVYIGPMKALVHERVKDWREKFEKKLGMLVAEAASHPLFFFEFPKESITTYDPISLSPPLPPSTPRPIHH